MKTVLALTLALVALAPPRARTTRKPYKVENGKVDQAPSTATAVTAIPACNATGRTAPAAAMRQT